MSYCIEQLQKTQPVINSERYSYSLRHYENGRDVLGCDIFFRTLDYKQFGKLKHLGSFKIVKRVRNRPGAVSNIRYQTVYERRFSHVGQSLLGTAIKLGPLKLY